MATQNQIRFVQNHQYKRVCVLADESLEYCRSSEGPAVFVRNRTVYVALKEGEHGEPDSSAAALLVRPRVGKRVVIQEESGGDVERDEDIDGIMLVSRQDEEDPEQVQNPRQRVYEVPAARRVCKHRKTKHQKQTLYH